MKKKIGIGLGVLVLFAVVFFGVNKLMASKGEVYEEEEDPYGIEYYTVPDMDQVFVNGVIKPEQSQEFQKEEALGNIGEIQVENGDTVEAGTLLYTYESKDITTQIIDLQNQAQKMETQKANADNKLALAIKIWHNTAEEERMQTLEEIKMDMSTDDMGAEIREIYNTIESLKEEQFTNVLAPFTGKVYIPEEKDAESAILKLISDNFYVSGTVNERDVEKLAVEQLADIKVISNDRTVTGKVSFIDLNPADGGNDDMGYMGGNDGPAMSNYPIKLSLDSLEGIRNGYHVQAVINLGESAIKVPTKAIHQEEDQYYVLVNDFGTVVRRVIQIGEEEAENTIITSGLEAEDQIIISSKLPIEEGQVLSEVPAEGFDDSSEEATSEEQTNETEEDTLTEEEE